MKMSDQINNALADFLQAEKTIGELKRGYDRDYAVAAEALDKARVALYELTLKIDPQFTAPILATIGETTYSITGPLPMVSRCIVVSSPRSEPPLPKIDATLIGKGNVAD